MGKYQDEWAAQMEAYREAGVRCRSIVDLTNGAPDLEEFARDSLALFWEIERGHSCVVECLDPPIYIAINTRTGRRFLRVSWRHIPAWLGDRFRWLGMQRRILRDRLLGIKNPYVKGGV